MTPRLLPALALLALGAAALPAQSWRTVTAMRQARVADGADTLRVDVDYAAGRFRIARAPETALYDLSLRYDEERFDPIREFDTASRTLRVGVRQRGKNSINLHGRKELGELSLGIAPGAPVDLLLDLGATESDLDMSGLSVRRLVLHSGASAAKVRFGTPNPIAMKELTIEVGAAGVEASGLGNAHADRMRVKCGVGGVELDFSGAWAGDMELSLDIALGGTKLRIPSDVGVRVSLDKVLAGFDHPGFVKRGDRWYSANWETAQRKLTIEASTVFGSLNIERIGSRE